MTATTEATMASTATEVWFASAEEPMTATTETTTAGCINSTVGTAQETTDTMKATESMSATAEIMSGATALRQRDSDYSSADTMDPPPKNAEVMQALTAEEKAWLWEGEQYRAWAKN